MQEITCAEFSELRAKVNIALVPIGALEEHGSHLPLGLDSLHAWELAKATSAIYPCFVAPLVFYGLCRSTSDHAGTIGISGNTLQMLLQDIGMSLAAQKIKAVCFLTGHAGGTHGARMLEAGEYLLKHSSLEVAVVSVMDLLQEVKSFLECPGDSHAGEMETSLAMHLWPQMVKGTAPEEYPTFPSNILVRDKLAHWPGGVWGNPAYASAEKGERILSSEARALAAILAALDTRVKNQAS